MNKNRVKLSKLSIAISAAIMSFYAHADIVNLNDGTSTSITNNLDVVITGDGNNLLFQDANGRLNKFSLNNSAITSLGVNNFRQFKSNYDSSVIIGANSTGLTYFYNGQLYPLLGSTSMGVNLPLVPLAGINKNGTVIVGTTLEGVYNYATYWILTNGSVTSSNRLAMIAGTSNGHATAVNAAGDTIVGYMTGQNNATTAIKWVNGTPFSLGMLNNGNASIATAINAAGDVIVGTASDSNNKITAFKWTNATNNMVSLGTLNNGILSSATAINAAGNVIVGYSSDGNQNNRQYAVIWENNNNIKTIENWLTDNGVNVSLANGVTTYAATSINDAGNIVVGTLSNNNLFIARNRNTDAGPSGAGLIDVQSFNQGLAKVANSGQQVNSNATLVMNGMHSNPMRMLLSDGHSSFSAGGDIGRKDSGVPYNSDMSLGEITYGHRFNQTVQLNLSAGETYSRTDTDYGGKTTSRSTYLMPEFIFTLSNNIYATTDIYYGQGKTHINRGYDNAGNIVMTNSSPNAKSFGARLRLDWLNLFSLGKTDFTPYTSFSHMESKMDSYTEKNTAFPTLWNSRTDSATVMTVGMDAIHPINDRFTLQGRLEASHQFENNTALTSGDVIGLYGFAFKGQEIKQNWLRAGIGGEANIGQGVASVMLNATTQGAMPTYWVSANYKWSF